jgi:hypothetical protein
MLREEIEQVKAIAREIAKEEIAKAMAQPSSNAPPKPAKVEPAPVVYKKGLK